uniref:Thioredoxin-like protein AAED1 n=1 Tax=Ciona intestinalis TaxID=7719 RepID=F7ARW3_CIOIN|nr:thioredoxin-like protein AAED1 [Ciona intestinalis]|eukprot:XP_002132136.1 thioredoxin-like protein AAED1 [Ciona intestinalis]
MEPPEEVEIQRLPENLFDLNAVDQCILRDRNGQATTFKSAREGSTCIIVFIRHFIDYVAKEYVEDFSKIFPRHLEGSNVKIIVIGCAPSRFIAPFCDETNFEHSMFCDSKRIIHKCLGLYDYPQNSLSNEVSPHVKSTAFSGFFRTVWRGIKSQVEQGDSLQQGGQLIIDQDGKILFFHRDSHPLDHTPINDLLHAANLPRIDFLCNFPIKDV